MSRFDWSIDQRVIRFDPNKVDLTTAEHNSTMICQLFALRGITVLEN